MDACGVSVHVRVARMLEFHAGNPTINSLANHSARNEKRRGANILYSQVTPALAEVVVGFLTHDGVTEAFWVQVAPLQERGDCKDTVKTRPQMSPMIITESGMTDFFQGTAEHPTVYADHNFCLSVCP